MYRCQIRYYYPYSSNYLSEIEIRFGKNKENYHSQTLRRHTRTLDKSYVEITGYLESVHNLIDHILRKNAKYFIILQLKDT